MNINDYTVLVTGASGGIGRVICAMLEMHGAKVVGVDIKPDISQRHIYLDICGYDSIPGFVNQHGPFGMVVHCAGVSYSRLLAETQPAQICEMIGVNLIAPIIINNTVFNDAVQRERRTPMMFVQISSKHGLHQTNPSKGAAIYALTKSAIITYASAFQAESIKFGEQAFGVPVVMRTICPGYVDTPMLVDVPEVVLKRIINNEYFHRLIQPKEIALLVRDVIWDARLDQSECRYLPVVAYGVDPSYVPAGLRQKVTFVVERVRENII